MKKVSSVMKLSFLVNLFLSLIKFMFGIIGKSSALVVDSIHSFSDLSTDVISIIGNKLANKPADSKHPYGHGKLEYLTSLFIGVVILFLGFSLISSSIKREIIVPESIVIFVSLFTIISKCCLSRYLIMCGKKYDNRILIASGRESSADVISSIVVLISSVCMQFSVSISILKYADIVASVIVGIFIVFTGFSLIKDNISVILGEQETDVEVLEKIRKIILSDENIIEIDNLVILKFGPYSSITCELKMDGNCLLKEAHDIVDEIENKIQKFDSKYQYITIHINPT